MAKIWEWSCYEEFVCTGRHFYRRWVISCLHTIDTDLGRHAEALEVDEALQGKVKMRDARSQVVRRASQVVSGPCTRNETKGKEREYTRRYIPLVHRQTKNNNSIRTRSNKQR